MSNISHTPTPTEVHWSESVDWRHDRWDPMSNAPTSGLPILHVRGRTAKGLIFEPMHYAYGGGDEQPPFRGWFVPGSSGRGYVEVTPVEWQPLCATYEFEYPESVTGVPAASAS